VATKGKKKTKRSRREGKKKKRTFSVFLPVPGGKLQKKRKKRTFRHPGHLGTTRKKSGGKKVLLLFFPKGKSYGQTPWKERVEENPLPKKKRVFHLICDFAHGGGKIEKKRKKEKVSILPPCRTKGGKKRTNSILGTGPHRRTAKGESKSEGEEKKLFLYLWQEGGTIVKHQAKKGKNGPPKL